jgi:hypothetical protein
VNKIRNPNPDLDPKNNTNNLESLDNNISRDNKT